MTDGKETDIKPGELWMIGADCPLKEIKPGTIHISQPAEPLVGSFPVRMDLKVLPEDSSLPVKGWTIGKVVGINGNKYIRLLNAYLKKHGKISEDDLSEEEIGKLYRKCEI